MLRATLTLKGLYGEAEFSGLPNHLIGQLMEELQSMKGMSYVNPTDFRQTELFLGFVQGTEKIAYLHGVHEPLRDALKGFGFEVVERRSTLNREFCDWKITAPPIHDSQPLMIDILTQQRRGAVEAPPGTGKTYVIAAVAVNLGVPTLCLTYNAKPTTQVHAAFKDFTNISPGLIEGKTERPNHLTVASVPKVLAMMRANSELWQSIAPMFKLAIVDEAHHLASPGTMQILRALPNLQGVMAVSATYGRADDKAGMLLAYGGPLWYSVPLEEVVGSRLVPLTIEVADVPKKSYPEATGTYSGGGKKTGYAAIMQQRKSRDAGRKIHDLVRKDYIVQGSTGRNHIIAEYVARQRAAGRTGVIIIKEIDHAVELCKLIPNLTPLVKTSRADIEASSAKGTDEIIDALKHRVPGTDWLVTTTFDEAVDVPSLDCVVLAAGGKTWIKAWQRLRNTRACDMMLRTGHYKKERGYVLVLHDHAPMVGDHSRDVIKTVSQYIPSHPDNVLVENRSWTSSGSSQNPT